MFVSVQTRSIWESSQDYKSGDLEKAVIRKTMFSEMKNSDHSIQSSAHDYEMNIDRMYADYSELRHALPNPLPLANVSTAV